MPLHRRVRTIACVSGLSAAALTLAACTSPNSGTATTGSAPNTAATAGALAPTDASEPATVGPSGSPGSGAAVGGTPSQRLADGVLHVCYTGDYRPFTYDDPKTGDRSGIDVVLMNDYATSLGVKVEWVKTTWATLIDDFLAKCDIGVGGISVTEERAQKVDYTNPVVVDGKASITTCGRESEFDTIDELNQPDTRIITPIGGTNEKFDDENAPNAQIIRTNDNNTVFEQIIAGNADVMVTDGIETVWAAHEHPELCAVNADTPFTKSTKAFIVQKGDAALLAQTNAYLAKALDNGTWDAAVADWFGPDSAFSAEKLREALKAAS